MLAREFFAGVKSAGLRSLFYFLYSLIFLSVRLAGGCGLDFKREYQAAKFGNAPG